MLFFKKKKKELDKEWLPYRVNHISWWKEEMASKEEMEEGLRNLSQYNNEVDFIISHCCATSTQKQFVDKTFSADSMTDYLELVKQRVSFKKWFFGHYHDNKNIGPKEILIYEKRTLNRFMKKLTVPGGKCNLKRRMNLRYACFKFFGM